MKPLYTVIACLLLTGSAWAADLAWDYDEDHDAATGYTVYFTDGVDEWNKTFDASEAVIDGGVVTWGPINERLNLHPGVDYVFALTRYNDSGESDPSNDTLWTMEAHIPPIDRLPDAPVISPGQAGGLRIE